MARSKVKLDRAGVGRVLRSQMGRAVNGLAQSIAANVDADGEPVVVRSYTTDRQAASVTIASWRGQELQAKNGALTRAANAAGVQVVSK